MKIRKLPVSCPSCEKPLVVSELTCENCDTVISGRYPLPILLQLPLEEQDFLFQFIKTGGSLKKMAKIMGKSYPTVRNKLDDILEKIENIETIQSAK